MSTDRTLVAVTGATGCVGSNLAELLVSRGYRVRALVRPTSETAFLESLGVELCRGDLTDSPSLAAFAAGVASQFTQPLFSSHTSGQA